MKQNEFDWVAQEVAQVGQGLAGTTVLATKALCVVHKHFLIPMAEIDLHGWRNHDHYRHRVAEIEDDAAGDEVWIKPWLIGERLDEKPCVIEFAPDEFVEQVFEESILSKLSHLTDRHKRSALFGIYLTVTRKADNWRAVFALRLDNGVNGVLLNDLPVREALCLVVDGPMGQVDAWLNWAYKQNS